MMRTALALLILCGALHNTGALAAVPTQILLRRDTAANWAAANPILARGEPGYATDTRQLRIGNGTSRWADLPAYLTITDITPDAIGAATAADGALARSASQPGHSQLWNTIINTPTTRAGYGIEDARGLSDTSSIIFGQDDSPIAVGHSYSIPWPADATFTAVICDLAEPPGGAPATFDVLSGSPPSSIFSSGFVLRIDPDETSTLTGGIGMIERGIIAHRMPVTLTVTGVGLASTPGRGLRCTFYETIQ